MQKPKALIACLADPSGNPRPNRAIQLLNEMGYEVWALAPQPREPVSGLYQILPLPTLSQTSYLRLWLRRAGLTLQSLTMALKLPWALNSRLLLLALGGLRHLRRLRQENFRLVLIEDLFLLPALLNSGKSDCAVVFDAREYYPREFESSWRFRLLHAPRATKILQHSLPSLDGFYTVCDSLANEYYRVFGRRPDVVRSMPYHLAIQPSLTPTIPLKVVHHGAAHADRGLATMIETIRLLKGQFTLDLYLVGSPSHIRALRTIAADCPWIHFRNPVPFSELGRTLAQYDIGFCLLQPSTFNLKYSLPNKFFEFIQARLAVLAGPSPELSRLIHQYSLGVTTSDFSAQSAAEQLSRLTPERVHSMKLYADRAAQELCWEVESTELRRILERALLPRESG